MDGINLNGCSTGLIHMNNSSGINGIDHGRQQVTAEMGKGGGGGELVMWKEGRKCFIQRHTQQIYLRIYGVRHMVKNHSDRERKPAVAT